MAIESDTDKKKKSLMKPLEQPPIGESIDLSKQPAQPAPQQAPVYPYQRSIKQLAERRTNSREPQKFVTGGVVSEEDDEDEVSASTQSAAIGGQAPAGATVPGAQPESSDAPAGSGSFVNPKQYIEANVPKTEQLSQQITGGFGKETQALRQDVAGQRETALGAGSQITQEQARLEAAQPFVQQTVAQAGAGGAGESDIERFNRLRTGTGGQQIIAPELSRQRAQASELERRAKGFGTAAGREEELERTVGKQSSRYTGGQKALDTLLLGGDAAQRASGVRSAREAASGLGTQVGTLGTDVQTRLAQQAAQRGDIATQATEAVAARRAGVQEDVAAGLSTAQQQQAALQSAVASGQQLTPEQFKTLGMSGMTGELYGENIADYIRFNQLGEGSFRTAEQAAQLNALTQLGGGVDQNLQAGGQQLFTQAGDFQAGVEQKRQDYETELQNLMSGLTPQQAMSTRSMVENAERTANLSIERRQAAGETFTPQEIAKIKQDWISKKVGGGFTDEAQQYQDIRQRYNIGSTDFQTGEHIKQVGLTPEESAQKEQQRQAYLSSLRNYGR
jgi:hypothetical protein